MATDLVNQLERKATKPYDAGFQDAIEEAFGKERVAEFPEPLIETLALFYVIAHAHGAGDALNKYEAQQADHDEATWKEGYDEGWADCQRETSKGEYIKETVHPYIGKKNK